MQFEFMTATRIIFGVGSVASIGTLARPFGTRALVVHGSRSEGAGRIRAWLEEAGIESALFSIRGEPTLAIARQGVALAREQNAELVISLGGGSVLDGGKAIAALATNMGSVLDYVEVIGRGQALSQPPLPFIAIPTTAGTGSEVTRNAVLASPEKAVKVSLRHPTMLAKIALIDPELTYDLPPAVTATTGMDALTQVIEPYTCNAPSPLTDALARDGIRRAATYLRRAYAGNDPQARQEMALVSLYGGLALANAKLGAVHGFAAPIGGMFPAPHGAVCARLLPFVMEANIRALAGRAPDHPARARYVEVAHLLTGDPSARDEDGVVFVAALAEALNIPPLRAYGLQEADLPSIVEKAAAASSMKGNPLPLTRDEMTDLLARAL
jgi:alcohol dehydrogenase class IV